MSRRPLSEFRAKSLLVPEYNGVTLSTATLNEDVERLDDAVSYVVKVDQGVKKRGKQGLLRLNVPASEVAQAAVELSERGFDRFLAEPMLAHADDEERYVSFERTREGMVVRYSDHSTLR